MKMKQACEATALTERAVRLYIFKGLISPVQYNGVLDFSTADVQTLQDIAILRLHDFSIEQISIMLKEPQRMEEIVHSRMEAARAEAAHGSEVAAALAGICCVDKDFHALAGQLRTGSPMLPKVDFTRFDELTEEERKVERKEASIELTKRETRRRCLGWCMAAAGALAVVVLLATLYLVHPRIQGYIPMGEFVVMGIEDGWITVSIRDERVVETLGCDQITVPYRAYRVPLAVGDTISNGCQLAVSFTNLDLLRIGINPLQTIHTRSEEVNREWMKLVLRSLFPNQLRNEATLWIREYNPDQYRLLFPWE